MFSLTIPGNTTKRVKINCPRYVLKTIPKYINHFSKKKYIYNNNDDKLIKEFISQI